MDRCWICFGLACRLTQMEISSQARFSETENQWHLNVVKIMSVIGSKLNKIETIKFNKIEKVTKLKQCQNINVDLICNI